MLMFHENYREERGGGSKASGHLSRASAPLVSAPTAREVVLERHRGLHARRLNCRKLWMKAACEIHLQEVSV